MSGFLWAKLLWGIAIIVAAAIYGAWQGWKSGWRRGFYGESDDDQPPKR